MSTVDFITALFSEVDEQMRAIPKHPEARLWPSEVVTLGLWERARLLRVLCLVLLAQLLLPPQVVHGISPVTISTHSEHIGGRTHDPT